MPTPQPTRARVSAESPAGVSSRRSKASPAANPSDGAPLGIGLEPGRDRQEQDDVAPPPRSPAGTPRHLDQEGDEDDEGEARRDHVSGAAPSRAVLVAEQHDDEAEPLEVRRRLHARGSSRCGRRSGPTDSTRADGDRAAGTALSSRPLVTTASPRSTGRARGRCPRSTSSVPSACGLGDAHVAPLDQLHPEAGTNSGSVISWMRAVPPSTRTTRPTSPAVGDHRHAHACMPSPLALVDREGGVEAGQRAGDDLGGDPRRCRREAAGRCVWRSSSFSASAASASIRCPPARRSARAARAFSSSRSS